MAVAQVASTAGIAAQEKAKLQKGLRWIDLVLFSGCAIVGLDTLALTSSAGGEAITGLAITFVFFFIPYGMLIAELGTTFPVEGGPYEWVKMSFGRLPGAITAMLYWVSNPIWIGGALSATGIAAINSFVLSKPMGTLPSILFGLAFTWVTVAVAIISIRKGKWVPNAGLLVKAGLVVFFGVVTVLFLVDRGHPGGTVGVADLKPTISGALFLIGILMFNWVGFEVATGASEEMNDAQRDIPKMVMGSGIIAAILYGLLLLFILLVIPKSALSSVGAFTDAYARTSGVLGGSANVVGDIVAGLVVAALFVSGATWLIGSDRVLAVAALDGAAPKWMGRFSRVGTPIAVNLMSGVMASAFVIFVFTFTKGSLADFFSVMISLAISTTALSYAFVFPSLVRLRQKQPGAERPFRVPGGRVGAWAATLLTELFVILTGITLLWPGLIDGWFGQSYSIKDSWGVTRAFFEWTTLGTFGVIILGAIAFWLIGSRNITRGIAGDAERVRHQEESGEGGVVAEEGQPDPQTRP